MLIFMIILMPCLGHVQVQEDQVIFMYTLAIQLSNDFLDQNPTNQQIWHENGVQKQTSSISLMDSVFTSVVSVLSNLHVHYKYFFENI